MGGTVPDETETPGLQSVKGVHLPAGRLADRPRPPPGTAGETVPAQIALEQITISFAVARSTAGLMALQWHVSSRVPRNICEQHSREEEEEEEEITSRTLIGLT